MTVSKELSRLFWTAVGWGAVYLLALPVYLVRFILRGVAEIGRFRAIESGEITCPHCGNVNALDVLATCRNCGATEFGSRLYCTWCRTTFAAFPCDACKALIRVF